MPVASKCQPASLGRLIRCYPHVAWPSVARVFASAPAGLFRDTLPLNLKLAFTAGRSAGTSVRDIEANHFPTATDINIAVIKRLTVYAQIGKAVGINWPPHFIISLRHLHIYI